MICYHFIENAAATHFHKQQQEKGHLRLLICQLISSFTTNFQRASNYQAAHPQKPDSL
jgi:hypothetical protein